MKIEVPIRPCISQFLLNCGVGTNSFRATAASILVTDSSPDLVRNAARFATYAETEIKMKAPKPVCLIWKRRIGNNELDDI